MMTNDSNSTPERNSDPTTSANVPWRALKKLETRRAAESRPVDNGKKEGKKKK